MIIAREKRKKNIAEYILYMWQIEDIIRVKNFDIDLIHRDIIDKFEQPDDIKEEMREWYQGLIDMMTNEGIEQKGHLQILNSIVDDLYDLHLRLLNLPEEIKYHDLYKWAKPNIDELKNKTPGHGNEIEVCFTALYGMLMLRLQNKSISDDTKQGIATISNMIAYLSSKFMAMER
jgi:hypothetical protein